MKKNIMELKEKQSVICYLQMLENNVSRMSSLSGIIKASMCVVYTIFITILIAINKIDSYWWLGIVITIVCMIIDAYYLALERTYVNKYNKFLNKLNNGILDEEEIYDMKPKNTDLKCEIIAMTLSAFGSFSVYGFYSLFILISVLIRFM